MLSIKVISASIKSMNPIQKHPHIIELFACILNMFLCFVFMSNKFVNFLKKMFYSKTVKIKNFNIFYIQNNPWCTNICIFIKIYYIFPILYCFRPVICRINSIKSKFILLIILDNTSVFQNLLKDGVESKISFKSITIP